MGMPDSAILEDLLQRHLDHDLSDREARELDRYLRTSVDLRREKDRLDGVVALLEESRIPVQDGFQEQVMASLPAAGWEARSARAWRLPVAILGVLAAFGIALSKAAQPAVGSLGGAFSAAFDLLVTAALTGAGLMGASWKGLQIAFQGLSSGSPWATVGLVAMVLGLNLILFLSLRRRPRFAAVSAESDSSKAED